MIKIKNTDSIIDIISKIKNCEDENIIIEFPFGHPIMHNYLSLKILKNKADKKTLTIVTSDLTSKKIGKPLGIKYSLIKDSEFIEEENLLKHNYTFFEYFKFEVKKHINEIKDFILRNKKINSIKKYSKKYNSSSTGLGLFMAGLIFSIFLLFFIFYFAVNKTYIYITPEIEVKTKSKNFIFTLDENSNIENTEKTIKLKEISESTNLVEKYITSGILDSDIKNATGKAKLINTTIENINLVTKTRLQAANGVVYEIIGDSFIPKAKAGNSGEKIPGTTIVNIKSKLRDTNGKVIGARGNTGTGIFLTIPGLKDPENYIYAETYTEIKGGSSNTDKVLSEEDLENAKKILEEKLKKEALDKLKLQLIKNNKINKSNYDILNVNSIIGYSNLEISQTSGFEIGEKTENFELKGSIDINTYIYNKETVINKLRNTIKDLFLEEIENILLINNQSLRVSNTIYKENNPFEVKATMEIEVYYSQNFLNKNNTYIEKLKGNILGLNKDEAKKILINNKKISDVEIEVRPFFIKSISNIPDNIVIKVEED